MRLPARAFVAATAGALGLAAFAGPAATASASDDGRTRVMPTPESRYGDRVQTSAPHARGAALEDPVVTGYSVNAGKPLVLGTTYAKTFTVEVTASHPDGIYDASAFIWHGADPENPDGIVVPNETEASCTPAGATTSTCTLTLTVDPTVDLWSNALAGGWKVSVSAVSNDGGLYWDDYRGTTKVLRAASMAQTNATPEPVAKGGTVTLNGKLSRANWETLQYGGYPGASVGVQYRKASVAGYSGTYKTVTSSTSTGSWGALKTTAKQPESGCWRYNFTGSATTQPMTAPGDCVTVK